MAPKLCPKLILEGTRLTDKTELAFRLTSHPRLVGAARYRYHHPLVSAEWCAFTDVPWGRGAVNYAPEEEAQAMETFAAWARLFELQPYYAWTVDRFHLSARAFQRAAGRRDPDFSWLDPRLRPLGFRHVLCTRDPASFEEARARRLEVSGNPRQYDDLARFVREQEDFRRLVRESTLPFLEVDVTDGDLGRVAEEIAGWLAATNGLSAPWGVDG